MINTSLPVAGLRIVEPTTNFCNCKAAYSAGLMNGMFYICIIILILLIVLAFCFKLKKDREKEDEDEDEDEFYNGEET